MQNYVFAFLNAFALSFALWATPAMALKNGRFAEVKEFPSSIYISTLIMKAKPDGSFEKSNPACTATKISDTELLTAAHCYHLLLETFQHDGVTTNLSQSILMKQRDDVKMSYSVLPIKKISFNHGFDIAIIQLDTSKGPSLDVFKNIPIAEFAAEALVSGKEIYIGGYGTPANTTDGHQKIKMAKAIFAGTSKTLESFKESPIAYSMGTYLQEDIISQLLNLGVAQRSSAFSKEGQGQLMPGDSGGAVYVKSAGIYKVIGVNSSVASMCTSTCSKDNYFIRFDKPEILGWIREVMQK